MGFIINQRSFDGWRWNLHGNLQFGCMARISRRDGMALLHPQDTSFFVGFGFVSSTVSRYHWSRRCTCDIGSTRDACSCSCSRSRNQNVWKSCGRLSYARGKLKYIYCCARCSPTPLCVVTSLVSYRRKEDPGWQVSVDRQPYRRQEAINTRQIDEPHRFDAAVNPVLLVNHVLYLLR